MGLSIHTLVKIAACGGIVTVSMGFLARHRCASRIRETPYYQEALRVLTEHKGAVYILGDPVKPGSIDIDNEKQNFTKDLQAQYQIPIKGSKQSGTLYFWAVRKSTDDDWIVRRMELSLANEPNRRLLVRNIDINS